MQRPTQNFSCCLRSGFALMLLSASIFFMVGCDKQSSRFQMTIDRVDELNGMILKGISISGTVETGCIANDDAFVVTRNGKEIHQNTVRVLNVKDLQDPDNFNGEVYIGDYVTLYIPDGKKQDIQSGDILSSNTISCDKAAARK
jgi:selenocysteine-specific translation elongation factor